MEIILHELVWLTWTSDFGNVVTVERSGKLTNAQHTMQFRRSGGLASTRLVVPNLDFIMACKRSETDDKGLSSME